MSACSEKRWKLLLEVPASIENVAHSVGDAKKSEQPFMRGQSCAGYYDAFNRFVLEQLTERINRQDRQVKPFGVLDFLAHLASLAVSNC